MAITRTHSPLTLATSVTAATRPTSPPVGTVIMVSDRGNRVEWWDGTNWRYGLSNVSDKKQKTDSNKTTTSTTPVDFDTATDITLPATTGDVIELSISMLMQHAYASYQATDVATVVSGSPVNYVSGTAFASSGQGVSAWRLETEETTSVSGSVRYTLVSGDISSGTVLLRLRIKVSGNTGIWLCGADYPAMFMARNLGPCNSGALTAS